jgi:transketolase
MFKATLAAADSKAPIYIRTTGGGNVRPIYDGSLKYEIGKAIWLRKGKDMTFITTGSILAQTLDAADILKQKGIDAGVVDMHTVKPIDREAVLEAMNIGPIVTVEEHNVLGGLGAAVCEVTSPYGGKVNIIGIPDIFGPIGTYFDQLERYGLTGKQIAERVIGEYLK